MALFRNLSVNLRDSLFPPSRRDAQSLDFLDLAKNCSSLDGNVSECPLLQVFISGWALAVFIAQDLNFRNKFLAEPGWLFPERRYLKRISPNIAAG